MAPTTTEKPTTTEGPTTSEVPTTTEGPTTSEAGSTTESTVQSGEVQGEVVVRTEVTPDDVQANRAQGVLAFTGGSSTPLVVIGIVLLLVGATLAGVSWQRNRRAAA